jgi:hypothetical protein
VRYRKKPVEIEAKCWSGTVEDAHPIIQWINTESDLTAVWREEQSFIEPSREDPHGQPHRPEGIYIKTLEGEMHVSPGDYVIQGVQNEFYPCKPDIFADTYDKVSDE